MRRRAELAVLLAATLIATRTGAAPAPDENAAPLAVPQTPNAAPSPGTTPVPAQNPAPDQPAPPSAAPVQDVAPSAAPAPAAAPMNMTGTSGDFRAKASEYRSAGGEFHKPNGPVTVTADRAEWQQAGIMHYTGNVQLSVDTLELRGDNLELKQFDDGLYQAHLTGDPAHLTDAGAEGSPPIAAQARKLDYDARTSIVELSGGAVLTRGADRLTGENIRYDVAARRVQAAGGNAGQVRIVIHPAPEPKR